MSVAIHPSETRRARPRGPLPGRLRAVAGLAVGGAALAAFTAGAFSFFSDLADPRARPARVAPMAAAQWPDLKDGVPALAAEAAPELRRASLPEPAAGRTAAAPRAPLPLEPAQTVPASARTAPLVAPARLVAALPPGRSETVRAREEPPGRFVSLPAARDTRTEAKLEAKPERREAPQAAAAKSEPAKPDAAKSDEVKANQAKADPAKPAPAQAARKPAPHARTRVTEARAPEAAAAQAASAAPAERDDEPELLGVKIPGGRQIRAGWDAAVGGLLGKGEGEGE